MPGKVLVIGDCTVRQNIGPALTDAGFTVVEASNSMDGLKYLQNAEHRIVILSEDVHFMEDMKMLPILKRQTSTPVIVVGSDGKQAVVNSLNQGADVHLPRTTSVRVVVAYLRALLRRHSAGPEHQTQQP